MTTPIRHDNTGYQMKIDPVRLKRNHNLMLEFGQASAFSLSRAKTVDREPNAVV